MCLIYNHEKNASQRLYSSHVSDYIEVEKISSKLTKVSHPVTVRIISQ